MSRDPSPPGRTWLRLTACFLAAGLLWGCYPSMRYLYRPVLTATGADFMAALTVASGNEVVDGNDVVLLENGIQAFPAMLGAIAGAKSSVHMEMYIFRDSEIGREFVEALAERARTGVRVRLLLDALGSTGFGDRNRRVLEDAGAYVEFFRPVRLFSLRNVHLRTHRKVLIVDGETAFTGGICIDDSWMGDADAPDRWRETQVLVRGPVVRQMQVAFARAWLEATGELLNSQPLYPFLEPVGDKRCQLMDSTPGVATNPARLSFLVAVESAQESLDVTNPYFVPDRSMKDALMAAARRGVRVRLILSGRKTDIKPVRYAGRISYHDLLEAGVEIFEYQPARLHAKTAVVDGLWATVGSTNINRRSFAWNYESNLNVFDRGFAGELVGMFERDLLVSRQVTLEDWKERPFSQKIKERFWGIFRSQF